MDDQSSYEPKMPDFDSPAFRKSYIKALKATYIREDRVAALFDRIMHMIFAVQIVQIIQAITLVVLAVKLLLR